MAHKPSDFLIGIVDFFAILLPGAVAAFFSMGMARTYVEKRPHIFGALPADFWGDAPGWVVFAVASYLLGQFIYLLGSLLDWAYNQTREFFIAEWIESKRLAKWIDADKLKRNGVVKWLRGGWVYNEALYEGATAIKGRAGSRATVVKTYQWAKANVLIHSPEASAEIHRLEADQKFFRGLIVVLLFVCGLLWWKSEELKLIELAFYVLLMLLSFWKYVDQRRKSQDLAYTYLIALKAGPPAAPKPSGEPERVETD